MHRDWRRPVGSGKRWEERKEGGREKEGLREERMEGRKEHQKKNWKGGGGGRGGEDKIKEGGRQMAEREGQR